MRAPASMHLCVEWRIDPWHGFFKPGTTTRSRNAFPQLQAYGSGGGLGADRIGRLLFAGIGCGHVADDAARILEKLELDDDTDRWQTTRYQHQRVLPLRRCRHARGISQAADQWWWCSWMQIRC